MRSERKQWNKPSVTFENCYRLLTVYIRFIAGSENLSVMIPLDNLTHILVLLTSVYHASYKLKEEMLPNLWRANLYCFSASLSLTKNGDVSVNKIKVKECLEYL